MRLPNGMGSIVKRNGNRRKPYWVRKTVIDSNGDKKRVSLGWTETKQEAIDLLMDYNNNPWNLDINNITFKEVFQMWLKHKASYFSKHTVQQRTSAFNRHCKKLYDIPYRDIRLIHFMEIIEDPQITKCVKFSIRKLFRALDEVAYEYDIISKQYSKLIPSQSIEDSHKRQPFSEFEIKELWNSLETEDVDLVLLLIYTGFRSQEFSDLLLENIDLKEGIIIGGSKTKAGKNRRVPIHTKIKPLLENRIKKAKSDKLLNYSSKTLRIRFKKVMKKLHMNHIPHECRYTLRTRLDNADANKVATDMILGHHSNDVGERVYTKKTIKQLKEAIELLD